MERSLIASTALVFHWQVALRESGHAWRVIRVIAWTREI